MTFSDLIFIFRLLPIFLIIYYIMPCRFRAWLLLCASLGFYYYNEPKYVLVLAGATLLNYGIAKLNVKKKNTIILAIIVIINISMMTFFKVGSTLDIGIVIPLGVSYYSFKMISYQVDLYKGRFEDTSFVNMANYFFMFPQIISGPIARYDFVLDNPFWSPMEGGKGRRLAKVLHQIENGLKLFVIGLFMKVIIADHLSVFWSDIRIIGYESISTPLAWLGAYVYSLNLYFDFWGYSLMAAGLGVMLGFPFIRNFYQPYAADSVSDFYRRWHSTLGNWFRDYIYFPLGGSKKGKLRTAINIIIVWVVTGLWHGLTPHFLAWAGTVCVIILFEKFVFCRFNRLFSVVGRVNVLVLIPITWVMFAIKKMKNLRIYMLRLFPVVDVSIAVNQKDIVYFLKDYWLFILFGVLLTIPAVASFYKKHKDNVFVTLIIFAMFWISIYSLANSTGNPFMYLRF